ncbi:hypothetical protein AU197_19625 [Mycobacterium sp. IS-1590]|uniref:hypothetical protein n=1 Tax=Mycobacterium sp. IS-1590 TaxID=1772286 RepID=UPI0007470F5C|nr:hypothetical protein [Mycobacterium sp. IS-1590]KUI36028.1 hypothetical protein AU197_19625 [Mycobacterium sp. IS-1590]
MILVNIPYGMTLVPVMIVVGMLQREHPRAAGRNFRGVSLATAAKNLPRSQVCAHTRQEIT